MEVVRGGHVEIPLQARGQLGKNIRFLLREPPVHGTLGPLRQTGRDSAAVIYTHRAEDGPVADRFSYAVQAPGTAVSAAALVEVHVLDDPPRPVFVTAPATAGEHDAGTNRVSRGKEEGDLHGNDEDGEDDGGLEVDFGNVPAGSGEARRELWVENRGGGTAVGVLELPPPWTVAGAAGFRLGRDERQAFTLVFRPGVARTFSGQILVGRGAGVRLVGVGLLSAGGEATAAAIPSPSAAALPRGSVAMFSPPSLPPRSASPVPVPEGGTTPAGVAVVPAVVPRMSDEDHDDQTRRSLPPALPRPLSSSSSYHRGGEGVTASPVQGLFVQERGPHRLTVTWPEPRPAPAGYRVERRRLWLENGELRIGWDPYENVVFTTGAADGRIRATLRGLGAGEPQAVRVVAVNDRGVPSAPSGQLLTATLGNDRPWWRRVATLRHALFAGLAVCLFQLWRQRRRGRVGG